jgi:hypothetical protein
MKRRQAAQQRHPEKLRARFRVHRATAHEDAERDVRQAADGRVRGHQAGYVGADEENDEGEIRQGCVPRRAGVPGQIHHHWTGRCRDVEHLLNGGSVQLRCVGSQDGTRSSPRQSFGQDGRLQQPPGQLKSRPSGTRRVFYTQVYVDSTARSVQIYEERRLAGQSQDGGERGRADASAPAEDADHRSALTHLSSTPDRASGRRRAAVHVDAAAAVWTTVTSPGSGVEIRILAA